jgi:pimeloyl-ACP methyl ester carboxylesterase
VEDVAGALSWLGERGIDRVALVGTSMGGMTAIAAVAILGDGSLPSADMVLDPPAGVEVPPRPAIVALVADSVPPELVVPVANRLSGPGRRFIAARLFDGVARLLGTDPRATEPIRMVGLVAPVPLLLIHGDRDAVVPIADGRRLAAAVDGPVEHWVVAGCGRAVPPAPSTAPRMRRIRPNTRSGSRRSCAPRSPGLARSSL